MLQQMVYILLSSRQFTIVCTVYSVHYPHKPEDTLEVTAHPTVKAGPRKELTVSCFTNSAWHSQNTIVMRVLVNRRLFGLFPY